MRYLLWTSILAATTVSTVLAGQPIAIGAHNVTYKGADRNGIEVFLGIPFGKDTGGQNRFKPPSPIENVANSIVQATQYGDVCPQPPKTRTPLIAPLTISENCLNLNIARPKNTKCNARLPVMVYIYGGGFWTGATQTLFTAPDGLILESVENGLPVIHVAMNYRLGVFGFAQSTSLRAEGSENAGIRDQRLAIEWVRDNIAAFGGDPNRITIFGQSSGGLSVGMQLLAYGGKKPAPFHQAIAQSQALEPGITANYSIDAMKAIVNDIKCNSDVHSPETVACLRKLTTQELFDSSSRTYNDDANLGDIWLPSVDGDFVPSAPSKLIREHKFANVNTMIGWCENDVARFIGSSTKTANDTEAVIKGYIPDVESENIKGLLALYPVSDFEDNASAGLAREFYRASQIVRDILMVCQPMYLAENLAAAGNQVRMFDWNQTMLGPTLEAAKQPGRGVVHTSEFAYIFGNITHYNISGLPFNPTESDYQLQHKGSRSWSTFASIGKPSLHGRKTLQGFEPAFRHGQVRLFVAGGPHEGLSPLEGSSATPEVAKQKLKQRCEYLNRPEIIEQLRY